MSVLVYGGNYLGAEFSFQRLIPPFAVLPVLLFIGLYIVALSFLRDKGEHDDGSRRPLEYYMPSAIGVILTPEIGLEYSLPLSILSYWLVKPATEGPDAKPLHGPSYNWVTGGAAGLLVLLVLMHLL